MKMRVYMGGRSNMSEGLGSYVINCVCALSVFSHGRVYIPVVMI